MVHICLKDQFKFRSIRPEHDNPMTFITSQWQYDKNKPSIIYLFVRLAIFITFLVIWILSITMETQERRQKWPIYLTNWGFTLCLLQSGLSCILLIGAHADEFVSGKYHWKKTIHKMYSIYWILHIMATTVAFTITLIYWPLIYSAEGAHWSTMNFMVHGFNSILMLVDFSIVSHPVLLLHFFYPVLIGLGYTIMTIIFYNVGGTTPDGSEYIYPILKWDQPGTTIGYCLIVMLLMIIIHVLTYFIFMIRAAAALIHKRSIIMLVA